MSHEKTYTLAKLALKTDPDFVKAARQGSSNKPENLEKRRLDFQQESMILQALIAKIQQFYKDLHDNKEPEARARLEQEISAYSNLANLKGLAGLYDGFAMLADMLSIRTIARDENDKPVLTSSGEKIFIRVPVLYDLGADLEDMIALQERSNRIAFKTALKLNAVHVAQREVDPDNKEPVVPGILAEEAPAGVPESDLKAAQAKPTDAQVETFVKG